MGMRCRKVKTFSVFKVSRLKLAMIETSMDGKEGFLLAFGYCRKNLRFIGLWPPNTNHRYTNACSLLRFYMSFFIILISIVIVQTIQIFLTWGDLDATSDIISTADLPIGLAVLKGIIFFSYRKEIRMLLLVIKSDWNEPRSKSETDHMRTEAHLARRISLTCIILGFITVNLHVLIRIGQELALLPGKTEFRLPLFEGYFPFDYRPSPYYEFVWFIQYFGTGLATFAYSGMYCFFVACILHLCGQFAILRDQMDIAVHFSKDGNGFRTTLIQIVEKHEILNRTAEVMERIFNVLFLSEIVGCTVQFCMQGFLLVTISSNTDLGMPYFKIFFLIIYVGHIGVHLFICCYVADKFQEENNNFFRATYNCEWWTLPPKDAMLLIMVMHRTNKPVQFTAGKFAAFSMQLYAQIFKSSGGYLSMLLAVRDRLTNL